MVPCYINAWHLYFTSSLDIYVYVHLRKTYASICSTQTESQMVEKADTAITITATTITDVTATAVVSTTCTLATAAATTTTITTTTATSLIVA